MPALIIPTPCAESDLLVALIIIVLLQSTSAALIGNWLTCNVGDTCNSGFTCCVALADLATGKRTCRPIGGDCAPVTTVRTTTTTRIVTPTSTLRNSWETCFIGDTCNAGYICCVGVGDLATGKRTCRPINGDCAAITSTRSSTTTVRPTTTTTKTTTSTKTTTRTTTTTTRSTTTKASTTTTTTPKPTTTTTTITTIRTTTTTSKTTTLNSPTSVLRGDYQTCYIGDSCSAGFTCCIGVGDLSTGKRTCRPINGDCAVITTTTFKSTTTSTTTKPPSPTPSVVGNWLTCHIGDVCNSGYTCCVGVMDVATGKRTCRPVNGDCATVTSPITTRTIRPTTTVSTTPVPTMPPGFKGKNYGIGSWFLANSTATFTNGNSWCGFVYQDYTLGFAPDITVMTNGTNAVWPDPGWEPSGTAYCGLEAIVTNVENGNTVTLYIADAFDHRFVKSPGSIDIMIEQFSVLKGRVPYDNNDVMMNVSWQFTGRRAPQYSFKGPGDTAP
ncbi:hypothetical protein HK098_000543 [Nowakowskiella sp. JEL0407]|nr:hypothetical protein HK098_000543 [Nowakowskiella sp. JEL0407]